MRSNDSSGPPAPDVLGYLLTWTAYGTWLPGDERGWTHRRRGDQLPDQTRQRAAARIMKEAAVHLAQPQRALVEDTVREHCEIRVWTLLAINCRSNHVHVVVHCQSSPHEVLRQFKQWTTRRLNEQHQRRTWWSERGSGRYLYDQTSLESAIIYVRDAQDRK